MSELTAGQIHLTIAIPTYNRPRFLKDTLQVLLPQLTSECRLIIVDNASEPPVEEAIDEILAEHTSTGWQIVRNPVNIGANANILRCMELCTSEWLWIVSDDDRLWDDAVANVLGGIAAHPDCAFISFAQKSFPRTDGQLVSGRAEFLRQIEKNFYTLLFISTTVYRIKRVLPSINYGYSQISSLAPHLAVMTMASDRQDVYFSEKTIVEYVPAREGGWSQFWVERGLPLLLDLPLAAGDRILLRSALRTRLRFSGIFAAFIDTLGYGVRTHDPDVCAQLFRMAMLRRATASNTVLEWIAARLLLLALAAPRLTIMITGRLYPMMKGQSFEERTGSVGISLDERV